MRPDKGGGRPREAGPNTTTSVSSHHDGRAIAASSVRDGADEPVQLTEDEARRLTKRITLVATSLQEQFDKLGALIDEAREGQAHVALGYPSWTAYISDVFGGQQLRLGRRDRQQLTVQLADMGMSTRAIAPIVGANQATVSRDLARDADASPAVDSPDEEPVAEPMPNNVIGLDGKRYTRPEPAAKPRRSPLPDAYWRAVYELEKATDRLVRLHQDDRFLANRAALHDRNWRVLHESVSLLQDVENDLEDSANKCGDCDGRIIPTRGAELAIKCASCRDGGS